jgi:RES domain
MAGTTLYRVHRTRNDPVFFGPGKDASGRPLPPSFRFDSPSGAFGVLYIAKELAGAVVETILRNPERQMVALSQVMSRAATELRCSRDLRMVQLHGAGLQQVGTDNAISTGPYEPCGLWAAALWRHPEAPDGIEYQSRHDPDRLCWVLFERPTLSFVKQRTILLGSMLNDMRAILRPYGKSISP